MKLTRDVFVGNLNYQIDWIEVVVGISSPVVNV